MAPGVDVLGVVPTQHSIRGDYQETHVEVDIWSKLAPEAGSAEFRTEADPTSRPWLLPTGNET